MAKYKGIILCNGGYSSSLISAKLNELGGELDMVFDESGMGVDSMENLCDKYDLVLLAPHLSMYYDDYIDYYEEHNKPLFQIQPQEYVVSNIQGLWNRIKECF